MSVMIDLILSTFGKFIVAIFLIMGLACLTYLIYALLRHFIVGDMVSDEQSYVNGETKNERKENKNVE